MNTLKLLKFMINIESNAQFSHASGVKGRFITPGTSSPENVEFVVCGLRYVMKKDFKLLYIICLIGTVAGLSQPGPASAAEEILLNSDQSRLIALPIIPATIVVGNPSIADVTTDGNRLFFHPRSYGVTNVIILDMEGKKARDYLVRVIYEDSYGVSMYQPAGRKSYSCRKDCEPVMRIGDEDSFFSESGAQARSKSGFAASQALGEELVSRGGNSPYGTSPPVVTWP